MVISYMGFESNKPHFVTLYNLANTHPQNHKSKLYIVSINRKNMSKKSFKFPEINNLNIQNKIYIYIYIHMSEQFFSVSIPFTFKSCNITCSFQTITGSTIHIIYL